MENLSLVSYTSVCDVHAECDEIHAQLLSCITMLKIEKYLAGTAGGRIKNLPATLFCVACCICCSLADQFQSSSKKCSHQSQANEQTDSLVNHLSLLMQQLSSNSHTAAAYIIKK